MNLYKTITAICISLFAISSTSGQYAYVFNTEDALKKNRTKLEKILFVNNPGDTVVFERNYFDERTNLTEYLSRENMPIQARVVYHYDEESNCIKEDYYRNHILYQYKIIDRSKDKIVEEFFSVTGKPKGLKKTSILGSQGEVTKCVVKRKGQPNLVRLYEYHPNGKLSKIREKIGSKKRTEIYDLAGLSLSQAKNNYQNSESNQFDEESKMTINLRRSVVSDVPEEEVISCGLKFKDSYILETRTYIKRNGLNDKTAIFLDGKLLYEYLFTYKFYSGSDDIAADD